MMTNAQAAALAAAILLQSHGASTREETWDRVYDNILETIRSAE